MSMAQWVGRGDKSYLGLGDEEGVVAVYDAQTILGAAAKPFAHTTRRIKAPLARLDPATAVVRFENAHTDWARGLPCTCYTYHGPTDTYCGSAYR